MKIAKNLLIKIAEIGKEKKSYPPFFEIQPFQHFLDKNKKLLINELDLPDGAWSRREVLARYLLLSAVLDQGPDMEGVRLMTTDIVNEFYKNEIRIFHRPLDFFKEIGVVIDNILKSHNAIKKVRSVLWAKSNKTNSQKYNLFMDNSRQVLNYAIFRWGVPLALPLLLAKDGKTLVDYLEMWESGENMSQQLKDNDRYGLGKAIGDKAAHLFVKWYVDSLKITRNKQKSWGILSYELPLDSNAGRVLFRSGYFLRLISMKDLEKLDIIQKGQGKGGSHYIRVTNLRGKKSKIVSRNQHLFKKYVETSRDYLKTAKNPRTVEIQRISNILLIDTNYGIGDLDDGLMYIGTNFCFNLEEPKCNNCPINKECEGYNKNKKLITNFRT